MTRAGRSSVGGGSNTVSNSVDGWNSSDATGFMAHVLTNIDTVEANRETLSEAVKQAQDRAGYVRV